MTASDMMLPGRSAGNGGALPDTFVGAGHFAALFLPGGVAKPDELRTDERAVHFVRQFAEAKKPIAAICHSPWTLIDADAVRGK